MRREILLALSLYIATSTAALAQSSTTPAQMGITPATLPEVLQVLDNTKTWVPIGEVNSASHTFIGAGVGAIDVRSVGMRSGGQDNSPYVQALWNAVSPPNGVRGGATVVFPPVAGQNTTYYYFSQPLVVARGSTIDCRGSSSQNTAGPVQLVFPPGVDGIVNETGPLTPDGGWGQSELSHCMVTSLGGGTASNIGPVGGNSITGVYLNNSIAGDANFTFPASCNPIGGACVVGVGDGVIILSNFLLSKLSVAPGAYVGASDPSSRSFTLAAPYTITQRSVYDSGAIYDLPAAQKYTIQTTTDSNTAIVTAGPRLLRPGDMLWSDAFLFGASVTSMANAIAGAPTVNAPGSGYIGASGTMTYSGPECAGTAPVLNVTASGGAIASVASVANAGNCLHGAPSSTNAANWTPGGGLSGGSGASFNATFNQTIVVFDVTLNHPANAVATHTAGSPGQMWTIPAGVTKRVQGRMSNDLVSYFGVDLRMDCQSGTVPITGCNGSTDRESTFTDAMVGRLSRGNNTGVSTAISNVYAHNYIVDEVEAGTIGSTYISEGDNSQEAGNSLYGTLAYCDAQNASVFIGSYLSGQGRYDLSGMNVCMAQDAQGNPSINAGSKPGQGPLFVGSLYGAPAPYINAQGRMGGTFTYSGSTYVATASAPTPSGSVITLAGQPWLFSGLGISDATNPAVIPANTTVTAIGPTSVTISNPLAAGGVQVNDQIVYTNVTGAGAPCFTMTGGLQSGAGLSFDKACGGGSTQKVLRYYGYGINAWGIGTGNQASPDIEFITADYSGYNPYFIAGVNLPFGFTMGGPHIGQGSERMVSFNAGVPADTFHKQGDVTFNSTPAVGSPTGWVNVANGANFAPFGVVSSFSGTKTAGACTFTIVNGVITNVTGC